jgi:sugar O-acyltransferase (sialic acid O-acetyltransferase NeuD family)
MKRETIAIVGAGGFGREVKQLIDEINLSKPVWDLVGFFDTTLKKGTEVNGLPILGNNGDALNSKFIENFVIAIGSTSALNKLGNVFVTNRKKLPNIQHPSAIIDSDTSHVGFGNIFCYGFFMTTNIKIGNLNVFNTRLTLGHDVVIGSYNVFLPNVQISGHVTVGDCNLFGMNSSVLKKKSVGSNNKVGAHSFVINDIDSNESVFGIPAGHF